MSSQTTVRSSTADRKSASAHTGSTRPRVPPANNLEVDRQNSTGPHSRKQSGNVTASERRTEKSHVITKETVTVRTRSPLKQSTESRVNARRSRELDRTPKGSPTVASSATYVPRSSEDQKAPWNPQAYLIPHSTAPLASRVSAPPLSSLAPQSLQPQPLSHLSLESQEAAIIEDLLYVFMGFEGQYIRYDDSYNPNLERERLLGPSFRILPGLDPSLRDLTTSMLKMATHYAALETFVQVQSRAKYGAVNQALCAAVRKLLKDYLVLTAQLEHQMLTNPAFTLHVLNLHTKPTSHMLYQLYTVAIEVLNTNGVFDEEDDTEELPVGDDFEDILVAIRDGMPDPEEREKKKLSKGGVVLGLITTRLASLSGDPAARTLLTTLLREASRPYMAMLNEWLHHGAIKDPHNEFLINEATSIKRERLDQDYTDQYWEKRYTIRADIVPPHLYAVQDKVLLAGKYLNVVRECGGVDISKVVTDVPTSFDDPRFLDNISEAYASANSALLNLLLADQALPARLRSLKHYFFLDQSDFFSYFLELGASELDKRVQHVNVGKLQSLLDIVLRQPGSVAAEDPFKEDVKVEMNEVRLADWLISIVNVSGVDAGTKSYTPAPDFITGKEDEKELRGFEALTFDYVMPFPISLVVSRVTLTRYQLLFRYLCSLRHLEAQLINSWSEHAKGVSWKHHSSNRKVEMWKRRAWTLRARMLVFVQALLYYCTWEVIEPNWQDLMARLNTGDGTPSEEGEGPAPVKRTVDELMQDHVDFLASCLKQCMLTNAKLLKINQKILNTCTMFASYTRHFSKSLAAADEPLGARYAAESGRDKPVPFDPKQVDKITDLLARCEYNFSRHLKIMLDTLNYFAATETAVFLSLCARLSTAHEGLDGG